jgi:hypothetical protein
VIHATEAGYAAGCKCNGCKGAATAARRARYARSKASGGVDVHDSPAAPPGELLDDLRVA